MRRSTRKIALTSVPSSIASAAKAVEMVMEAKASNAKTRWCDMGLSTKHPDTLVLGAPMPRRCTLGRTTFSGKNFNEEL